MNNLQTLKAEMDHLATKYVVPIQTTKLIDSEAGSQLCDVVDQICRALKGESLLPRQILNDIRTVYQILQNEAPNSHSPEELMQVATDLQYSFDLILLGESRDDRISGVPRII